MCTLSIWKDAMHFQISSKTNVNSIFVRLNTERMLSGLLSGSFGLNMSLIRWNYTLEQKKMRQQTKEFVCAWFNGKRDKGFNCLNSKWKVHFRTMLMCIMFEHHNDLSYTIKNMTTNAHICRSSVDTIQQKNLQNSLKLCTDDTQTHTLFRNPWWFCVTSESFWLTRSN